LLVSFLTYPSVVKMEAICFFEILVDFCWTTWCYILECSILHRSCLSFLAGFLLGSLKMEAVCSFKMFVDFTRLHGFTSQKTALFRS
jgi:hypothetical protein